ncbi:DUF2164 domain-containing protein [Kiloniella antarctica]|uniref:DUF2164 domain-containing protein n=1 Tax=Kiloniella antarctica TaxID=1550907 RepID=A0ABW5BEP7_9PROT
MRIKLDDERKAEIAQDLVNFFYSEFDENMSAFRAEEIVNFMLKKIGPSQYNQGIADAQKYMAEKIEDLDTEFHEPDD